MFIFLFYFFARKEKQDLGIKTTVISSPMSFATNLFIPSKDVINPYQFRMITRLEPKLIKNTIKKMPNTFHYLI